MGTKLPVEMFEHLYSKHCPQCHSFYSVIERTMVTNLSHLPLQVLFLESAFSIDFAPLR